MMLLAPQGLRAQTDNYPKQQSSVSVYASTLLLASVANLSYEHLWRPSETSKVRLGLTAGYTFAVQHWSGGLDDPGMGPHLAFTLLAGRKDKFFELKLGGTALFEKSDPGFEYSYAMPVISLGFRKQNPEKNRFFRWSLSTAGIGFGFGYIF
ncbi:MAG TPA: hypothetical protein P5228_09275 [Bacteroidales bacterium]|nr:hypothetical protein [Bacteroidales bacterium]HRZ49004.1 hypothetical protein [Bacteroidales bacterium]